MANYAKKANKGLLALFAIIILIAGGLFLFSRQRNVTASGADKQIIRLAHNQSSDHPTHIGMLAFEEFIESKYGDKYDVQIYPSELLGTQTNLVQLTQTGAIEVTVASNSILETFNTDFQIFNLPYLFESPEAYHAAMDDPEIVASIFNGTIESGFVTKAWLDAGTRNFYVKDTPIDEVSDLAGKKIRVQQSPTNVSMMNLLGGSATPMGFGDVYTAIQSGVIDGAENNELALTENGHGDVVKNYSYTMHQMIPDEVIVSTRFLEALPESEQATFDEAFKIMEETQHQAWEEKVAEARDRAENDMNVVFNYPDIEPFKEAVLPLHDAMLEAYPELQDTYNKIQEKNENYTNNTREGDAS
ncbi:TRAP transporter substrate-binding protein [Aerococcus urinaeequi]|uniref:TRAP transporter substrate-binding protein DctP n=1 Tax=Aerococcus viridans TaxID=1377 RepID=A0A2N6UCT8_9LACT|nr:TRAP transporter substrate-binding protein [Aerococcus viridans]PMC79367.1 TRAP transporter substrate-binding protein DctP [Aerococcus viridans]